VRQYLLARLLTGALTALGVVSLVFLLMRLIPGTIADQILAQGDASEEVRRSLTAFFGLERPLQVQYQDYLLGLLRGDLGLSWRARFPVSQLIAAALPVTLQLALMSALVSLLVGVVTGVLSAVRRDTLLDHLLRTTSLFSLSIPTFWQATMAILLLSVGLRWAPLGYVDPRVDPGQSLLLMALPALCLGTSAAASVMRMTRSCLLEVLGQDYIQAARARGLREQAIVLRHGLKNALIPVVTILGIQFGSLLGGSVVVESVFGLPGLGLLILNAIAARDYPVVQGAVIFTALRFMLVNLLVDLLYGWLDPRIRYGGSGLRRPA
jgi:peptide/nickel transport system permease protein